MGGEKVGASVHHELRVYHEEERRYMVHGKEGIMSEEGCHASWGGQINGLCWT